MPTTAKNRSPSRPASSPVSSPAPSSRRSQTPLGLSISAQRCLAGNAVIGLMLQRGLTTINDTKGTL